MNTPGRLEPATYGFEVNNLAFPQKPGFISKTVNPSSSKIKQLHVCGGSSELSGGFCETFEDQSRAVRALDVWKNDRPARRPERRLTLN